MNCFTGFKTKVVLVTSMHRWLLFCNYNPWMLTSHLPHPLTIPQASRLLISKQRQRKMHTRFFLSHNKCIYTQRIRSNAFLNCLQRSGLRLLCPLMCSRWRREFCAAKVIEARAGELCVARAGELCVARAGELCVARAGELCVSPSYSNVQFALFQCHLLAFF